MKTFLSLLLLVIALRPVPALSQTTKTGAEATSTAKPGAEATSTANPPPQKPPSGQVPTPAEPTSSQPFVVPAWLLGVFGLVVFAQYILAAKYSGIRQQIADTETARAANDTAFAELRNSFDELRNSANDAGTKLAALRDEVSAIRRSQEPILAIAVNRMASASQFPFAPQVTEVRPDHGAPEGGTHISIIGRNFSPDAQIWFGGINRPAEASSTATRLDVVAPAASAGEVEVYVVNPNGMMSQQQKPHTYRYTPFHLTQVSISPGLDAPLRLVGEGFTNTTRVLIDDQDAGPVTLRNDKSIQLPLPTEGAKKGDRRKVVLLNDGRDRSEEITFVQP